jgi:four helix bundle protein
MSDKASTQKSVSIEETDAYRAYVMLADRLWNIVAWWTPLAADTVGKQLIRAADTIAANLIQGDKSHTDAGEVSFLLNARASARETRYWLQRARARELMTQREADEILQALTEATRLLNTLIHARRQENLPCLLRETAEEYLSIEGDPFLPDVHDEN